MSGLFSILQVSGEALRSYTSAMGTFQQNLLNSTTPGYSRQTPLLVDLAFRPQNGLQGGVTFAGTRDSRDPSMDATIRFQISQSQRSITAAGRLSTLTSSLDAGGSASLGSLITSFFTMAQTWAASSNDTDQRQAMLNQARLVAMTMSDVAKGVAELRDSNNSDIEFAVSKINSLAGQIAGFKGGEALSQASLTNTLEQLSELVDITVSRKPDGTVDVLLGGQVPLVSGGEAHALSVQANPVEGSTRILTGEGMDVTGTVSDGQLGAYLTLANQVFPSLIGRGTSPGSLNTLAKTFADKINQALGGIKLFTYDSKNPQAAAASLQVPISWTPEVFHPSLAQVDQLAALSTQDAGGADLGGVGFADYFKQIVVQQSDRASAAKGAGERQSTLLDQAQRLRSTVSGVDITTEAVSLMQMQQNFQAVTKVMTTVNDLIDSLLNLVR